MAYTRINFKTKKELKEAVAAGKKITCFDPGPFGVVPNDGIVYLEGPHYPKPHTWYARGTMKNGYLAEVK